MVARGAFCLRICTYSTCVDVCSWQNPLPLAPKVSSSGPFKPGLEDEDVAPQSNFRAGKFKNSTRGLDVTSDPTLKATLIHNSAAGSYGLATCFAD